MSAEWLDLLWRLTLAASAAILAVLLLRRFVRIRFGAQVAYATWLLVPACLVAMLLPAPTRIQLPVAAIAQLQPLHAAPVPAGADPFDPRPLLLACWLLGVVMTAIGFLLQQRGYLRSLGRLRVRAGGRIVQSDLPFAGPALVGAWRSRIVLPSDFAQRYDAHERALIIAHERVHCVRGDAWVNALVAALRALGWFNPLLHYAAVKFRIDQELACDAAVIARFPRTRRRYADAMLKVQLAGQDREYALPVGCRWPSNHALKERIIMLARSYPTRGTRLAGHALVALVVSAFSWTAWASQAPSTPALLPPQAAPADGRQVDASLRVDIDGIAGKPVRIVHPLGDEFEIEDGSVRARFIADATVDGNIRLSATLRQDERVLAEPIVVVRPGESFEIGVDDAGREHLRLQGTLAFAGGAHAGVAAAPDSAAAYRAVKAPVYPAEAVRPVSQARDVIAIHDEAP